MSGGELVRLRTLIANALHHLEAGRTDDARKILGGTVNEYQEGVRVERRGRLLRIDMVYPRNNDNVNEVEVGIECVRAADSILISYDFDRDGYSIKQASRFEWFDGEDPDSDWQEVAFIPAWGRQQEHPPEGWPKVDRADAASR